MYAEIEGSDYLSPKLQIGAPGFAGEFSLRGVNTTKGFEYVYSVQLSPASEKIEDITTTILTVSPKYVIINNTDMTLQIA